MISIESWKVKLAAGKQTLCDDNIHRGIFQGDSLIPLLFVIAMMSLIYIFTKCTGGYKLTKSPEKIKNHKYMDGTKIIVPE